MSRISLAALIGALLAQPAQAWLTTEDVAIRYAQGKCEYRGYVLELSCDRERKEVDKCVVKNIYHHGEKISYPDYLPIPSIKIRYPEILYCEDPPEKKKEEKKPFLCC